MKYLFCLQLLSCFLLRSAFAQQDTIQRKQDSLLTIKLEQQQKKVKQLSEDRLADSLKRTDLQKQLSTADNMQKGQLLQKLEALRQKDSLRTIKQKHQIDSLRAFVKGFPVVPFRDTLFFLFTRQGSFTAKDRAEAVSKRINILSAIYAFKGDSLKITPTEQTTDILFRDQLLISISDQDALWQHTSREALAAKIKAQIGEAVTSHQQETRWQTILVEALLALLVVIVTILLIYGLNRLFRWLHKKLAHQTGWFNKGIHIKGYELLNAENELALIGKALVVLKWAIILLIVYLALPILFGIFPFTRDVSDKLLNYFISPLKKIAHALWDYIPNLMTILVLLVVFRYVLKFVKFITTEIEKGQLKVPGFYADWANPTYQIVRVLVLAFMLIVIFPYLPGSDSGVFKGVSVFMGVLFTFGSAGALGNVVAGLVLT